MLFRSNLADAAGAHHLFVGIAVLDGGGCGNQGAEANPVGRELHRHRRHPIHVADFHVGGVGMQTGQGIAQFAGRPEWGVLLQRIPVNDFIGLGGTLLPLHLKGGCRRIGDFRIIFVIHGLPAWAQHRDLILDEPNSQFMTGSLPLAQKRWPVMDY